MSDPTQHWMAPADLPLGSIWKRTVTRCPYFLMMPETFAPLCPPYRGTVDWCFSSKVGHAIHDGSEPNVGIPLKSFCGVASAGTSEDWRVPTGALSSAPSPD